MHEKDRHASKSARMGAGCSHANTLLRFINQDSSWSPAPETFAHQLPVSYMNVQRACHDRLGLDFPSFLRTASAAPSHCPLTAPDLFDALRLGKSKKFCAYINMFSAEAHDKFVAVKERTMDKILGGHYDTP